MKGFFSKCDQIRKKLQILSQLLKKSLMKNFIFCAVRNKMHKNEKIKPWLPLIIFYNPFKVS